MNKNKTNGEKAELIGMNSTPEQRNKKADQLIVFQSEKQEDINLLGCF